MQVPLSELLCPLRKARAYNQIDLLVTEGNDSLVGGPVELDVGFNLLYHHSLQALPPGHQLRVLEKWCKLKELASWVGIAQPWQAL